MGGHPTQARCLGERRHFKLGPRRKKQSIECPKWKQGTNHSLDGFPRQEGKPEGLPQKIPEKIIGSGSNKVCSIKGDMQSAKMEERPQRGLGRETETKLSSTKVIEKQRKKDSLEGSNTVEVNQAQGRWRTFIKGRSKEAQTTQGGGPKHRSAWHNFLSFGTQDLEDPGAPTLSQLA